MNTLKDVVSQVDVTHENCQCVHESRTIFSIQCVTLLHMCCTGSEYMNRCTRAYRKEAIPSNIRRWHLWCHLCSDRFIGYRDIYHKNIKESRYSQLPILWSCLTICILISVCWFGYSWYYLIFPTAPSNSRIVSSICISGIINLLQII